MPATTKPTSVLFLDVNDTKAAKSLKRFTKNLKRNATAWNQSLELVSKAFRVLDVSLGALIRTGDKWSKLAAHQIRVENRLKAVLAQRTTEVDKVFDALQRENKARQALLGIGDEEQIQLQGTLALMGVRTKSLNEATKATFALAEITGGSLNEASRVIAKVFQGQVSALREYGITATSVSDAQSKLNDKFQTLAANSQTLKTRVMVLNANWSDFTETMGRAVQESRTLAGLTDALATSILDLDKLAEKNTLHDMFAAAKGPAAVLAQTVSVILQGINAVSKVNLSALFAVSSPLAFKAAGGSFTKAFLKPLVSDKGGLEGLIKITDDIVRKILLVQPGRLASKAGSTVTGGGGAGGPITAGATFLGGDRGFFDDQDFIGTRDATRGIQALPGAGAQVRGRPVDIEGLGLMGEAAGAVALAFADMDQAAMDFEITWASLGDGLRQGADLIGNTLSKAIQGFGNVLGQQIADMITGMDNLGKSVSEAVGDMLVSLGTQLIQMGTAALIMGALSFIPGLQAFTGPPGAGLVAGAIAIPAGIAMVGVGKAMGGGGSAGGRTASSPSGRPSGSHRSNFDAVPDSAVLSRRDREAQAVRHEVHFNGIVGDERRVRRMLKQVWENDALDPADTTVG